MGSLWRRLWYLLRREQEDADLQEEMETHRAMMGDPRQFGNALRLREECQDVMVWTWLDQILQDLRFGWRSLRKSPSLTITAVLTLSFGIGLNLALFKFINASILRPPAIRDPNTFSSFHQRTSYEGGGSGRSSRVPYDAVQFLERNNSVLEAIVAETSGAVRWADASADPIVGGYVSANYFSEVGYGAARGRTFSEEIDGRSDAPPVVVLSHDFWRSRLGSDPIVIGSTVRINGQPATVIGIIEEHFPGLEGTTPSIWMPLNQMVYSQPGLPGIGSVRMYGRLRPGVSAEEAREGLRPAMNEWDRLHPTEGEPPHETWLEPYMATEHFRTPEERREILSILAPVAALTLLVLLVACANLGNLLLSRMGSRIRELGLRSALGAGHWRVMRQLVTEHAALGMPGAIGGLALGSVAATILASRMDNTVRVEILPDWRTALALFAITTVAILSFALIPAWRICRKDLAGLMKDGGLQSSSSMTRSRLSQVLVGAQVMGSCVVLVVAGLMSARVLDLVNQGPGFDYERVAVLEANPLFQGIEGAAAREWWLQVKEAVASHPETEGVALCNLTPLGNQISVSGYDEAPGLRVTRAAVEPEFFSLLRIPIVEGRGFLPDDDPGSTVILSRRLARAVFGSTSAVGQRFPGNRTIVGVADDARIIEIYATDTTPMYTPLPRDASGLLALLATSREDPERLLPVMRAAAAKADTRVLPQVRLMRDSFEDVIEGPRFMSSIAGATGLLTLLLACLGIFGLVSFWVSQRTKEIGVRVALGAQRGSILLLALRQLSWPLTLGVLAGLGVSLATARALSGDPLYLDPAVNIAHLAAIGILTATAAFAALLPARRALRIDPVQAIRHE